MKKMLIRISFFLLLLAVVHLSYPKDAHAYLDPGTGTYLLQLLVAAILGVAVSVKIFWHKIKLFIKNIFSR